jgi:hypothetical protein
VLGERYVSFSADQEPHLKLKFAINSHEELVFASGIYRYFTTCISFCRDQEPHPKTAMRSSSLPRAFTTTLPLPLCS